MPNNLLDWKYRLSLHRDVTGATAEITQPLSLSFDIERTTQVTPNQANFTVWNLSESVRKAFEKMRPMDYSKSNDNKTTNYGMDDYCSVIFTAQRADGIECVLFKGDLVQCGSNRDGGEWETAFDCSDGYFAMKYGSMNGTYDKDAFSKNKFEMEAKKWKLAFEMNAEPVKNPIPITVNEKFQKTLDWAFPNSWYIDNGTLITGNPVNPQVYLIDGSRIAKTPKREENVLKVSCMFTPEPKLGNILEIDSSENGNMGQWEIAGINHKGEFPAGDLESEFTLIPPGAKFHE